MVRLDEREWRRFPVDSLFRTVRRGSKTYMPTGALVSPRDLEPGDIPRIRVTSRTNGINGFTAQSQDPSFKTRRNFISESFLGSVFYHPYLASLDMKVHALTLVDRSLNADLALFLTVMLGNNTHGTTYGNQISSADLARQLIMLPVDPATGEPDWAFMEAYVAERRERLLAAARTFLSRRLEALRRTVAADVAAGRTDGLDEREWRRFRVGGLFDITSGSVIGNRDRIPGDLPLVSASIQRNGVIDFIGNDGLVTGHDVIGVTRDGMPGMALWHGHRAAFTHNVRLLHPKAPNVRKAMDEAVGLFVATVITGQHDKYRYGYTCGTARLARQLIMLPVDPATGEPDWAFMEAYARRVMLARMEEAYAFLERTDAGTRRA